MEEANKERYESLKEVCLERRSVRKYLNKDIPEGVLEDILTTTQSAATSLNCQPYKILVIRSKEDKERLGKTMSLNNPDFVNSSSATVLFLADCKPWKLSKQLIELETAAGHSEKGAKLHAFAASWGVSAVPLFGTLLDWIMSFIGLFTVMMRRPSALAYGYSNTSFVIQQFVLLCQAAGLGNIILGGYDNYRIRRAFNISSRYNVCAAVCVGYEDKTEVFKPSVRYKPEQVIFESRFGLPFKTPLPALEVKQTWIKKME
ncbi:hypothetical protein WA158_004303 [Blastocystis sp. Blastoise]